MANPYETAAIIFEQLRRSELNPNAPGGLEAQQEQLLGNAKLVYQALAHVTQDASMYFFSNLLPKVRDE